MTETYEHLIQGLLDKGFECVDHWLTDEELVGLRESLLAHQADDDFRLAGIGNKELLTTEKAIRNDRIFWLNPSKANAWETHFFQKVDGFVDYLNRTCFAGIRAYEFQYAIYNIGSFYKRHVDRFVNDDKRQFSMVCYLSEGWEPGDGGELLLDDLKGETHHLEPLPGRMVFFQSDLPHEVKVSQHKRLSLTGWMKTL